MKTEAHAGQITCRRDSLTHNKLIRNLGQLHLSDSWFSGLNNIYSSSSKI